MKKTLRWLVPLILIAQFVGAQPKNNFEFKLPAGIAENDYQQGKVWVKFKPSYKSTLQSNPSGRIASLQGTLRPLKRGQGNANHGRVQAFKPAIDLSLYYEITFDKSISVETFINNLYATGLIEYAEPLYQEKMQLSPNDPSLSSQYFITKIKAIEAWDITQGSEDMIIGIIDSGVDINHPDLVNQIYINAAEANGVNGIDDDNNGYIDDIRGWDFSGADTLNAYDPDFVGDNDPAIYKSGAGFGHGTQVGGCAAASTNNSVGVAGVGFNSKLLFTKHFADNQPTTDRSYSSNLYQGILYAADNGAKIINCSWGGTYRSQVYQDILTHVTLDLGCLIVAAAGNENVATPLYPAAYDYVLSVGATDKNDKRASFSNYGTTLDLVAPGVSIFTTRYDDGYGNTDGTSFSSPITAGAAALVWTVHPEFTPLQVAEQLRVTADESIYQTNAAFLNKLGKGRLDVYKAVTETSSSVRALNYKLVDTNGNAAEPGDNAFLYFDFINYLSSTSAGLTISISTTSTQITITKGTISPGVIESGATIRNSNTPFELSLSNSITENASIVLTLTYSDGDYQDTQSFTFIPNPSFRDIDDNKVLTTLSGTGRVGYDDPQNSANGVGFLFNDKSILYEMGLIMGTSSTSILNSVRNASGFDQDFVSTQRIREQIPGERSYSEIYGEFSNSTTVSEQKVLVNYRSLVWRESPYDKFVILEYKIKNTQAVTQNDFYLGMFADWDISYQGGNDAAKWNNDTKMGYVYPKQSTELPHAGIQLLTGTPNYYAIDNDHTIAGNPLGLYDGYTDQEKFLTLSNGLTKSEAGNSTLAGNDVSHVISSGPYTIAAGEEITIAFALHAANNLDDLISSSKYADSIYNYTLKATTPVVAEVETCYGGSAVLTATGAAKYKWYKEFTGGEALASGNQLIVNNIYNDTTLYVSNATNTFESLRTPAFVKVKASPIVSTSQSTTFCSGESVELSVAEATSYMWSTGATSQSIQVTESGEYSVTVGYVNNELNCESESQVVSVSVLPLPDATFDFSAINDLQYDFTNNSANASTWLWNFGDGTTSSNQNTSHTYTSADTYEVSLTVTDAKGCVQTSSQTISIILSDEDRLAKSITVYPMPAQNKTITIKFDGITARNIGLNLMDTRGSSLINSTIGDQEGTFTKTISCPTLQTGIYLLKCTLDGKVVVKKVIVE